MNTVSSNDRAVTGSVPAPTGAATMSPGMREAVRYARYLYDCVRPWLKPPILEIGSGYGTYTELLLQHGRVIGVDIDATCLADLSSRFAGRDLVTQSLDLNDQAAVRATARHGFNSAFSTNVFEHIEDDVGAFQALREAIQPQGQLSVIVPAHPGLYGYMDEQAGHFRRYTRRSLSQRLTQAGWRVQKTFYINGIGGLGWWFNHTFSKPKSLDDPRINNQLVFYDRYVVPLARLTDWLCFPFFGLSVVAIAQRPT